MAQAVGSACTTILPTVEPPTAFEPDLEKWDAWSPDEVATLLAAVEAP